MTTPTVPAASSTESSATDFESDLGAMFGDYSTADATPDPEESAAGTTPAEPAAGAETDPDAEPAAIGDGTTTPESEGTTPDAQPVATEDDPFKDTTPATFYVNGQPLTSEDIRVFKEGGAVIRPESLPNVLSKLAERETLTERVRTRDAEYQTLAKATEWVDQSSGKTYTGPDAALEMRIGNASMFAENRLLLSVLTDPDQLARCLTTAKGQDGIERVVFSEDAINTLKRENSLNQREIAATIRSEYGKILAEASKPQPAPIDHAKVTEALIKDLATSAQLDTSILSPADKALLAKQLPFHIKDGLASLEWQELVKDRIELRTAQKQIASTTADATKKGLANMAAAARGLKPMQKVAAAFTKPAAPITPKQERAVTEGELFDMQEKAAAAAMRQRT